jgi:DNA-binding NarL/FixJ family response regulator
VDAADAREKEIPPRALVCDELALVRSGIAAVLEGRGIEVAVRTRSAKEAVSEATFERPDLIVCGVPADLAIPDAVRRFTALRPRPALVVLTPPAHDADLTYILAMGVNGLGLRTIDDDDLGDLVDAARKGGQTVVPALHGALAGGVKLRPLAEQEAELLSAREREVLVLLAEGRTNREIASALSITLATVKSHLVRIYAKLEAANRNEALGRAVNLGLLG